MSTGKTVALTRRTFVGKMISQLFKTLSRFVIAWVLSSIEYACERGREGALRKSGNRIMKPAKQDNMKPVGAVPILAEEGTGRLERWAQLRQVDQRGVLQAGRNRSLEKSAEAVCLDTKSSLDALGQGCPESYFILIANSACNSIIASDCHLARE